MLDEQERARLHDVLIDLQLEVDESRQVEEDAWLDALRAGRQRRGSPSG